MEFSCLDYMKNNHPDKAVFRLHEDRISLNLDVFHSCNTKAGWFPDTFMIIRMLKSKQTFDFLETFFEQALPKKNGRGYKHAKYRKKTAIYMEKENDG